MAKCPNCGENIEDKEYDCPFCGHEDYGEGFFQCLNCDTLFTIDGDEWVCDYCYNEGIEPERRVVFYDDYDDEYDEYSEDGIPDVNQGWVGEHYG